MPFEGTISIEAAVAELNAAEEKENQAQTTEANETQAEAAPQEGTDTAEASPDASNADGAETQTEGEQGETEGESTEADKTAEPEPLEAPHFWDAKSKPIFGKLSREAQEVILAKENERNAYVSRQAQEAAERRKQADEEMSKFTQLTAGLTPLLQKAQETFKSRWENVDWNKVVDQYGADNALKLKSQFELEQQQLQQLQTAQQNADQIAQTKFRNERAEKFKTVCPDLTDPKQGVKRQQDLVNFIQTAGIDPNWAVNNASAEMLAIAYDAMQWRNGKATAQTLTKKPAPPAPVKTYPVKPGSSQRAASPQQTRIKQLQSKRSLSIDEAVELENLRASP